MANKHYVRTAKGLQNTCNKNYEHLTKFKIEKYTQKFHTTVKFRTVKIRFSKKKITYERAIFSEQFKTNRPLKSMSVMTKNISGNLSVNNNSKSTLKWLISKY